MSKQSPDKRDDGPLAGPLGQLSLRMRVGLLLGTAAGLFAGIIADIWGRPESWSLTAIGLGMVVGLAGGWLAGRRGSR